MNASKLVDRFYFGSHGMFITPGRWMALHQMAQNLLNGGSLALPMRLEDRGEGLKPLDVAAGRYGERELGSVRVERGVAVIPLSGVIAKRVSWMDAMCGDFADLAVFDSLLSLASEDEEVEAIVVDIDSPGGYGLGLPETASLIREVNAEKPVYAYSDSQMCSAAYWIGAAAREIGVAPSADIGSIGSYCFVFDQTEQLAKEGVRVEAFISGKFKALGHPLAPMSEEQREYLRAELEGHAEAFRASVESDRPGIGRENMEGQYWPGAEAAVRGFADHVVRSLPEFVAMVRDELGL